MTEHHLTKSSFTERSYDRFFSENGHFTESTFDKKCYLTEKKCAEGSLTENSFDQKFSRPKAFTENGHLTEISNGQMSFRSFDYFFKLDFRSNDTFPNIFGQTTF
jgi:hypothetical protein